MNLTNQSYVIFIGTKNFVERSFRDEKGWVKVSARGRTFRATAEQVLNHPGGCGHQAGRDDHGGAPRHLAFRK